MSEQITPKWATTKGAKRYSGFSERLIQKYIELDLIESALVKKPGCERGVRLINLASLDAFIEAGIGQRVELKMNERKSKPPLQNATSH